MIASVLRQVPVAFLYSRVPNQLLFFTVLLQFNFLLVMYN